MGHSVTYTCYLSIVKSQRKNLKVLASHCGKSLKRHRGGLSNTKAYSLPKMSYFSLKKHQ